MSKHKREMSEGADSWQTVGRRDVHAKKKAKQSTRNSRNTPSATREPTPAAGVTSKVKRANSTHNGRTNSNLPTAASTSPWLAAAMGRPKDSSSKQSERSQIQLSTNKPKPKKVKKKTSGPIAEAQDDTIWGAIMREEERQRQREKAKQAQQGMTLQKKKKKPRVSVPKKSLVENPNPTADQRYVMRRKKEREKPKVKVPSHLKQVIIQEREKHFLDSHSAPEVEQSSESDALPNLRTNENDSGACTATMDDVSERETEETKRLHTFDLDGPDESQAKSVKKPKPPTVAEVWQSKANSIPKIKEITEESDMVPLPELDNLVLAMLDDLDRFQLRAKARNKAHKKRYVCGLREVLRDARSGKLKALLVAPNIERIQGEGGLIDVVSSAVQVMSEAGLPVIYTLSRRKLGRAVGKRVGVSAIGIIDHSGADEQFKMIKKLAQQAREEKVLIDEWIDSNELNQYGDPSGTLYVSLKNQCVPALPSTSLPTFEPSPDRNPLVNLKTGQCTPRYAYLLKRFQDRPWKKSAALAPL